MTQTEREIQAKQEIGARLRALREAKGLTRAQVGEALGMSEKGYGHIETGRVGVNISDLPRLAHLLETTLAYLLGEESSEDYRGRQVVQFFEGLPEPIQQSMLDHLRALHEMHVKEVSRPPIGGTKSE